MSSRLEPVPADMPACAVVVLAWNNLADTLECLESVKRLDYPNRETILVDNGSTDGTATAVREQFPQVHVIENARNLGYAAGNNVGMEHALEHGADYVMLLNNDTVVGQDLISNLVEVAGQHPDAGILGPKIYYYDDPNRIWYAGGKWRREHARVHHVGVGRLDTGESSEVVETDYVTGCALLTRRPVVERIGLLDPRFFYSWEDVDWCYRARREGYRCLFVPQAKVWHKVNTGLGGKTPTYWYYITRNNLLWLEKHHDLVLDDRPYRHFAKRILGSLRHVDLPSREERWRMRRAILLGLRDYAFRRFGDASC